MTSGIIDSLLPAIDSILGIRDSAGAVIEPLYFVTRTWTGAQPGDGTATDVLTQMLPSPGRMKDVKTLHLVEAGQIESGDIVMTGVSRNLYAESDLDGTSPAPNIEMLYLLGAKLFQVVNVTKKYVTWDITLRELTNQTRY